MHGLTLGMAGLGHDVSVLTVLSPSLEREPFLAAYDGSSVKIREIRVPPGLRHLVAERRAVRSLLSSHRPDLVHCHGFRPDILDSGIARGLGIPTVTTIHGESFMGGKTRVYEWLQWRNYRRFDAVIAVSSRLHQTAAARGVAPGRLRLIRNAWPGGVEFMSREAARAELRLAPNEPTVGWLGRMIPVKGGDLLLQALAMPSASGVTAVLIGDGAERERLRAIASQLGVEARVHFTGGIEGAARLLPAFDAFVLSSRSEGTPIVLLEAMSAGVPIVAARVGGVPDMVGEKEAVLVPPNDPDALASGLNHVLGHREAAEALARQARRRVEDQFSNTAWLKRHEDLYRGLVRPSPTLS